MKNKLNIAVVGCGPQGAEHIRTLRNQSSVTNIIGIEIDPQQRRNIAGEFNIDTAEDFYKVIQDPALDAVIIASSNHTHPPFAIAAFKEGKDVLCEKPLGPTLAECREVVEASRKYARILHCHFELRQSCIPARIRRIIASGEIGEVRSLNMIHYRGAFRPAWKGDPKKSGGLSLMETCHAIDIFRHLAQSEVREVQSFAPATSIPYYGFSDTEYLVMKMTDGALCHLTTCHTRSADYREGGFNGQEWSEPQYGHQYEYNILGSKGAIWYDAVRGQGLYIYHHTGQGEQWNCQLDRVEDFSHLSVDEQVHGSDIPAFLSAVQEQRDTHILPEDALKTHQVCFAVEHSRESGGQPVRPDEM